MNNKRETHYIDNKLWGDHTSKDRWTLNNEEYVFVKDKLVPGDGECHVVTCQRLSDKKLFEFEWDYTNTEYFFGDSLTEVIREEEDFILPKNIVEGLFKILCGVSTNFNTWECYKTSHKNMEDSYKFIMDIGKKHNMDMR